MTAGALLAGSLLAGAWFLAPARAAAEQAGPPARGDAPAAESPVPPGPATTTPARDAATPGQGGANPAADADDGPVFVEPELTNFREAFSRLPGYPAAARRNATAGYVILRFTLPADGRPRAAVVVRSEPKGVFDASALAHVNRLHFDIPPQWAGQHPERRHEVVYTYEITSSATPAKFPDFLGRPVLATRLRK